KEPERSDDGAPGKQVDVAKEAAGKNEQNVVGNVDQPVERDHAERRSAPDRDREDQQDRILAPLQRVEPVEQETPPASHTRTQALAPTGCPEPFVGVWHRGSRWTRCRVGSIVRRRSLPRGDSVRSRVRDVRATPARLRALCVFYEKARSVKAQRGGPSRPWSAYICVPRNHSSIRTHQGRHPAPVQAGVRTSSDAAN